MTRAGMNWKAWFGLWALVLAGLATSALAGSAQSPACTDLSAPAPDAAPGFASLAPRAAPACIRIALR
jgi:hypothetical protein